MFKNALLKLQYIIIFFIIIYCIFHSVNIKSDCLILTFLSSTHSKFEIKIVVVLFIDFSSRHFLAAKLHDTILDTNQRMRFRKEIFHCRISI